MNAERKAALNAHLNNVNEACERLPVIFEPAMPPNEMRWITASAVPVVICLDDDAPAPSTECEDDLRARILKHAAQSYAKISIP